MAIVEIDFYMDLMLFYVIWNVSIYMITGVGSYMTTKIGGIRNQPQRHVHQQKHGTFQKNRGKRDIEDFHEIQEERDIGKIQGETAQSKCSRNSD